MEILGFEGQAEFRCENCGCYFRANKNEYSMNIEDSDTIYYSCNCPNCKLEVIRYSVK